MKKRLAIVAALALPIMAYSLPTIAEDKPAGASDQAKQAMMKECQNADKAKMDECMKKMMADHEKHMGHGDHQAMMKECQNADKAKMDECMKKMTADHQKHMSHEGKSAGDAAKPAE